MKTLFRFFLLSLLSLPLSACLTTYPLGFSEEEWKALTPEQQFEARLEQAEIDEQIRRDKEAEKIRLAAEEARQREIIASRYRHAQYGDIIQCVMKNSVVDFRPGWRDGAEIAFEIVKGEAKELDIQSTDGQKQATLWIKLNENAMTMDLCRYPPQKTSQQGRYCTSVASTSRQYHKGVHHSFNVEEYMRGQLYCSLAPAP